MVTNRKPANTQPVTANSLRSPKFKRFMRIFKTLDFDQQIVCADGVSLLVEARAPGARIDDLVRAYGVTAAKLTAARAIRGDQDGVDGICRVVKTFVMMVREEHPRAARRARGKRSASRSPAPVARAS